MEQTNTAENLWRVWVDTRRRIVSFHEEEGSRLLEFRNRDMFFNCIEQYTGKQYRYQLTEGRPGRCRPFCLPAREVAY